MDSLCILNNIADMVNKHKTTWADNPWNIVKVILGKPYLQEVQDIVGL